MANLIDITGLCFGRWTVLVKHGNVGKRSKPTWLCKCECGTVKIVLGETLRNGKSSSCGCLQRERARRKLTKHGLHKTKEYKAWKNMMSRCYNKNDIGYKNYGARGIIVCERWHGSQGLYNFIADIGPYPFPHATVERIHNNIGYYPENCIWASKALQNRNHRSTKLTMIKARQIRKLREQGLKLKEISILHNVSISSVSAITTGKQWKEGII